MIRARRLQTALDVVGEPGAIADQDRGDDGGGDRIARRDVRRHGRRGHAPRRGRPPRATTRRASISTSAALLTDAARSKGRRSACQRGAGPPGFSELGGRRSDIGRPDPRGPPSSRASRPRGHAGDVRLDAARCASPQRAVADALDVNQESHAARRRLRVGDERAVDVDDVGGAIARAGGDRVEPARQRRHEGAIARDRAVRGCAEQHRDGQQRPSPGADSAATSSDSAARAAAHASRGATGVSTPVATPAMAAIVSTKPI